MLRINCAVRIVITLCVRLAYPKLPPPKSITDGFEHSHVTAAIDQDTINA